MKPHRDDEGSRELSTLRALIDQTHSPESRRRRKQDRRVRRHQRSRSRAYQKRRKQNPNFDEENM